MAINLQVGHKYVIPRPPTDRKFVAEYGGKGPFGHVFETVPDFYIDVGFGDEDLIEEYDVPRPTEVRDKSGSHEDDEHRLYAVCAAHWKGDYAFLVGYALGDVQSEKMVKHARQVLGEDYHVSRVKE